MTAERQRRPVTARDFNRLMFALVLLAALTVLARLITRQESRAETERCAVSLAECLQTADALFVAGEWEMAADAYFSALEMAAGTAQNIDVRVHAKLAESLYQRGERRAGIYFMRLYRARLESLRPEAVPLPRSDYVELSPGDPLFAPERIEAELTTVDDALRRWAQSN